jgi:beta-lactamase regulating signal transducer with metallopeptidase domain
VEAILRVTLSNTLLAAILALVALAISRTFRRPALSHAMWLIVLLKLITPPLWNVALPLIPPEKTQKEPLPPTELSMPPAEREPVETTVVDVSPEERWAVPTLQQPENSYSPPITHPIVSHSPRFTRSQSLVSTWAAGSALCLLIVVLRVRRFTSLLRFAQPADAHVQILARALSSRVAMKNCPRVWFVPGPLCPMLWAFGTRAQLLIPAGLWHRLDEAQRSTLLLHELAHYRRGDHWIRALELLITILFWWNPIAWWARHELREAEEQCCDAWVIWTLPRSARDYAIALMEAIDFVSTTRLAVPVLASPMGEFHDLKRRLLMIKQNAAPRALGWTGFSLLCVLAAVLLPLSATLAQQATTAQPPAGLPPIGTTAAELPPAGATTAAPRGGGAGDLAVGIAPAAADNNDPNAAAQREAEMLVEELRKTSDEIAKLTTRLHAAQARLVEIQRATIRTDPRQFAPAMGEAGAPQPPRMNGGRMTNGLGGGGFGGGFPVVNTEQDRRLRAVEQKLDRLIEELHATRPDRNETTPETPRPGVRR